MLAGMSRKFPGSLELPQAGTLRGLGSSQACRLELLETMLVFVHTFKGQR